MIRTEGSGIYVDAVRMFGADSRVAVPELTDCASSVAGDAAFQILCILLLLGVVMMLRYGNELRALLAGLVRGLSEDFDSGRKLGPLSDGFFNTSSVTGALTVAVAAVKYSEQWMPQMPAVEQTWGVPVAALGVVAAVVFVIAYEYLVLGAVGLVSGAMEFVETLLYVKKSCFAAVTLFLSPVVLLSALSPDDGGVWFRTVAAECLILSFLFLKETFVLFIRKKVPIFQWFLYLCTVEAFPLALIAASTARLR